jgi:hypothetical protein
MPVNVGAAYATSFALKPGWTVIRIDGGAEVVVPSLSPGTAMTRSRDHESAHSTTTSPPERARVGVYVSND